VLPDLRAGLAEGVRRYLPGRGEAEVFDRELEDVDQEPLVICPRPRRGGRFPPAYLPGADLDVPEAELGRCPGQSVGESLL
jgi:hypothetical protein